MSSLQVYVSRGNQYARIVESRVLQLGKNKNALNTPKLRVKRAFILFEKSISTSA